MTSLYVTEQGSSLFKRGRQIIVKKDSQVLAKVKTFDLRQVVVFGNVNVTTPVIHMLLKEGIDLVFLSASGKFRGRLLSSYPKNIELRKKQFERAGDYKFKTEIARNIVWAKINNQIEVLRREVLKGREELKEDIGKIKNLLPPLLKADNLDSIRGYEGRASAIYFSCFKEILREFGWDFPGRNYYPPQDEFNSLLSFLYTLLLNRLENYILTHSLEPLLGYFHSEEYGKPALALDLMEEWRPAVADYLALKLVRQGKITLDDFYHPQEQNPPYPELLEDFRNLPVVLTKDAIKKIIALFERRLSEPITYNQQKLGISEAMERQVILMMRAIEGKEKYRGFLWR